MKKFLFVFVVAIISVATLVFSINILKINHIRSLVDLNVNALANTSPTKPGDNIFGKTACISAYNEGSTQILKCGGCKEWAQGDIVLISYCN